MYRLEFLFLAGFLAVSLLLLSAWGLASYRARKERRKRIAVEDRLANTERERDTAQSHRAEAERDQLALRERFKDVLDSEAEVRRLDLITFQQRDEIQLPQSQYKQKREIFEHGQRGRDL